MLDDWGGKPISGLRGQVAEAYQAVQKLRREKEELERDARERAHLLDLYQFQVKEIGEAKLAPRMKTRNWQQNTSASPMRRNWRKRREPLRNPLRAAITAAEF